MPIRQVAEPMHTVGKLLGQRFVDSRNGCLKRPETWSEAFFGVRHTPARRMTAMSFADLGVPTQESLWAEPAVEDYRIEDDVVVREVLRRSGDTVSSHLPAPSDGLDDAFGRYWYSWLRSPAPPAGVSDGSTVTVADLFSGCGGLSLGVREAVAAIGASDRTVLAADMNRHALEVFGANFAPEQTWASPIEELVDGDLGQRASGVERKLARDLDGLDLLVGGPPCQGHSDLNNHTRRNDPKNRLYLRMIRFAEIVRPRGVIIENVPGVVRDKGRVVQIAADHLRRLGYGVTDGVIACDDLGWAQRRRRHVLLASLDHVPDYGAVLARARRSPHSVMWAIGDLADVERPTNFDTPARHSEDNRRRIDYLFDNALHDLPDERRPDCHRLKKHSYKAVYGRLHADLPAPTITSGFGSTGQGRFVHPTRRRTLTPHEAARLQGFPDRFDFVGCEGRRALQEMIGNAVPALLGYVAALEVLR